MSYNGSGTFVINTAGQPVVSGTVISSTAFNALTADLATGLSTAITKDGQTTPTANIPMGNNKITGLAVGTAATDAANLSQVQSTTAKLINSVAGADTVTGTMSPTLTAYAAGQMFYWIAAGANTGAVTLNIDSLGAKAVTRDGSTALAAGDIRSGEVVVVVYDGTRFQVVSQINSAGDATFANVSITSALNVGGVSTFTGLITANGGVSGALNGTVGATTPNTGAFTTLTTSSTVTLNGGTANGVLYLNGSKVATSGSALVFDGSNLGVGVTPSAWSSSYKALQVLTGSMFGTTSRDTSVGANVFVNSSGNYAYIQSSLATVYTQFNGVHSWSTAASGTAGNTISFTQAMTLDASGNLGIGTSSPGAQLEVSRSATNAFSTIRLSNTGASGRTYEIGLGGNTASAGFANNLYFYDSTAAATRMVIDSSGNLGLGVTPSAWGSAKRAIQVGSGGSIYGDTTATSQMFSLANAFFDGTNFKYIGSAEATQYRQNAGVHSWWNAASGTAGNTISFTQAMTLDASGNLLVANASASGSTLRTIAVGNATGGAVVASDTDGGGTIEMQAAGGNTYLYVTTNHPLLFGTNNTERGRFTALGRFEIKGDMLYDSASPQIIWTSGDFRFNTGSADRARITSGGELLVGTTSTVGTERLNVTKSANSYIVYFGNTNNTSGDQVLRSALGTNADNTSSYHFVGTAGGNDRIYIYGNGNISNTNGSYGTISDAKMKTDIVDAGSQWDDIKAVRFRKFKMKDDPSGLMQLGVVAQELEQTSPGLVDEHTDRDAEGNDLGTTTKSVKTSVLLIKAAVALQEAMARIESLEAKVAALEAK